MAWTYTITIEDYGTVKIESVSQMLKIDEALDSAVLVIPRSTRKNTFKRFKDVKISIGDGTNTEDSYWVIYADKSAVDAKATDLRYTHTVQLMEPTKMFEKHQCGSLTFRQPLEGTRYTMYDVVERIRQLVPFKRYADTASTRLFTIDSTLATYLDTINAPQFDLDKKNLREALVEVFKYINAIPRIRFTTVGGARVLYADFINNWHTKINVGNIEMEQMGVIDLNNEVDGEDYAQRVESFQENVITSEDNDVPSGYEASIEDVISFRSNDAILGDSSFFLKLSHKVVSLKSISVFVQPFEMETVEVDLTDFVVEKAVYDAMDADNSGSADKGYKSASAYWQYWSNEIRGFDTTFGWLDIALSVENMVRIATYEQYGADPFGAEWDQLAFKVQYIAFVETTRITQVREDLSDFDEDSAIQVNPAERLLNSFRSSTNLWGQIQRLGVDTVSISKKHKTLHTYDATHLTGIYSLGDYTDDGYMITAVEKIYFNSFVIARYEMSKNFNRIAQFMAVDKEFRPYEISLAKSNYTLKRDISMPLFYVEVSTESNVSHVSNGFVAGFMNTFRTSSYDNRISCAVFKKGTVSGGYDAYVMVPVLSYAEKNSLKFKMDFADTKIAGDKIISDGTRWIRVGVPYTESDGTVEAFAIEMYHSYWVPTAASPLDISKQLALRDMAQRLPYIDNTVDTIAYASPMIYVGGVHWYNEEASFPATGTDGDYYAASVELRLWQYTTASGWVKLSNYVFFTKNTATFSTDQYKILKDTGEILGLDMSLSVIPKSSLVNTFIIGDMMIKDNCLIKARGSGKTLYFYYSTIRFTKSNSIKMPSTATRTIRTVSSNVSTNTISVPSDIYTSYNYFGIGDYDGNMYLAVNQLGLDGVITYISTIYFNFLKERAV